MSKEEIAEAGSVPTTQDEKHQVDKDSSFSNMESNETRRFARLRDNKHTKTAWRIISWTPKRCRWDPHEPPHFSMGLNLLFGFGEILCVLVEKLENYPRSAFFATCHDTNRT
jgi:hypothetical protein